MNRGASWDTIRSSSGTDRKTTPGHAEGHAYIRLPLLNFYFILHRHPLVEFPSLALTTTDKRQNTGVANCLRNKRRRQESTQGNKCSLAKISSFIRA